jgi:hypothetical protein
MIKFEIEIRRQAQWYEVMRECRRCFGQNWCGQAKVRKKLRGHELGYSEDPVKVWFEVPDPQFVTWIGIKTGCAVAVIPNK